MSVVMEWVRLPHVAVGAALVLLLLLEAFFWPRRGSAAIGYLTLCVCLLGTSLTLMHPSVVAPAAGFVLDAYARFFILAQLAVSAIAVLLFMRHPSGSGARQDERYAFLLSAVLGAMLLASATDLLLAAAALALCWVSATAAAGQDRRSSRAVEAALKIALPGAVGTCLMLYAAVLVYGATGSTQITGLGASGGVRPTALSGLLRLAAPMVIGALGIALGMVPFHGWALAGGEGASAPAAILVTTLPRLAALALIGRVLAVDAVAAPWQAALTAGGAATAIGAAWLALDQRNVARLLGCAGVANGGISLVALGLGTAAGTSAALVQAVASALGVAGGFAVLEIIRSREGQGVDIEDARGLARRQPLPAAALGLFLLALGGLPLTLGFVGRVAVLGALLEAGSVGLAVTVCLSVALTAWAHLRAIGVLSAPHPSARTATFRFHAEDAAAVMVAVLGVVGLGLWPAAVWEAAQTAADAL